MNRKLNRIDILVFRLSDNELKNSKPCSECVKTMKELKIRKIYYTDDTGNLVFEKISNIENSHQSQLTRHIND